MQKVTNLYLFNEKMLHLVDGIFWHSGFKSAKHAVKVVTLVSQIIDVVIIAMIMNILIITGLSRKGNP